MADLPWAAHEAGLARWAAARFGWAPPEADWPSALALLVAAEDQGHPALPWDRAPEVWAQRFADVEPPPPFDLPGPGHWPAVLFDGGWLQRRTLAGVEWVQTARSAALGAEVWRGLDALARRGESPQVPGTSQADALARAGRTGLMVLAGGPGTGKTTTLRGVVEAWGAAQPNLRVVVAAPTGRAAARAKEAFGTLASPPECLTLHRLLGLRPGLGEPWHGPDRPLPFELVIVDEASMLDLRTAGALLAALGPTASLVLVGDPGQLPSVEAGSVLADVLAAPRFAPHVVRLTQRFRLSDESRTLAQVFDLLAAPGDPSTQVAELASRGDGSAPDFRWVVTGPDEDPTGPALSALGDPRIATADDLGRQILLSPVHRGPGGTQALGTLVDRRQGREPGGAGDGVPWMITRNLRHLELSNGDRGLVVRRDGALWFVPPEGHDRPIPFSLVAEDGESAWALSVHKSQGSEYERVVVVVPPGAASVTRELLYTALTRAKKAAVLVGSPQAVEAALGRTTERWSLFGPPKD